MMAADELKRAIIKYATGRALPVNEYVEIAESIDEVYEALAVQTSERDRWQRMIDIIEDTHGNRNSFSPVQLLNEMISLKERCRLADVALEKADEAVRRQLLAQDAPRIDNELAGTAVDEYRAARKEYDRMWRISPR